MDLKFERTKSTIYPAYLHVGDYSIVLDPPLIQQLKKECIYLDAQTLQSVLIQKMGSNRYLKEMLQEAMIQSNDLSALAQRLQEEIQSLE